MFNIVYFSIVTPAANTNKEFKLKIPEILLKLKVRAVNINSLHIGPTVYFMGRRILIQYPNDLVVCTLAFSPYRDSQVLLSYTIPHLESG